MDLILRRGGETILVQCKHWKQQLKVGAPTVRELHGAVARDKAARGIFVTSSTFTREAHAEAQGQPLELVDGAALVGLVKQAQGQAALVNTAQMPMPTNEAPSSMPLCPSCGSPMTRRVARKGANPGSELRVPTKHGVPLMRSGLTEMNADQPTGQAHAPNNQRAEF